MSEVVHVAPRPVRCAVYARKSSEEGLDQAFNSLDAQREAAEAYVASQRQEGWFVVPETYADGGFTGANMERPGLRKLMTAIEAGHIDCVVVYMVDRLSRSLLDFARLMGVFERHGVSFVSVTQQFNTSAPPEDQRVFISQPSASAGDDVKNDPWVNIDGRAEMHVFLQEGSQECEKRPYSDVFTNPSYRLSILTRGSSHKG